MKHKKYLFLLILLFPAALKLLLEFTTVNSKKLPHYGPKTVLSKNDTVFYDVNPQFNIAQANYNILSSFSLDTVNYPLYVIAFIKPSYKKDDYRLAGFSEYLQYKPDKIKFIPFFVVTPCDSLNSDNCLSEFQKLNTINKNVLNVFASQNQFDSLNAIYFKQKPVYIDYSFFVLVDKKRTIRGYYDGRYVAEIKRLTEEYQHLRLKEEKQVLIDRNKIESK